MLRELARTWLGGDSAAQLDSVRLAVVELPYAAVRSRLARNEPLPDHLPPLVGRAAAALISEARI